MKRINPVIFAMVIVLFVYGISRLFGYYYDATLGSTPVWLTDLIRSGM